jgi:hypothetical protein
MYRFCVATSWRCANKNRKRRPCWSVTKLASITFLSLAFSYWTDKPWFITEGKLLLCSSYLPLGVPNWSVIYISTGAIKLFSGTVAGELKKNKLPHQLGTSCFLAPLTGRKKTSARGVSHAHPLLCLLFCCYFIFTCIVLSKTQKK